MDRKTVGVLVSMLLIITVILPAMGTANVSCKNKLNECNNSLSDDIPIWEVGDKWAYRMDDINVNYDGGNISASVHGKINNLAFTVVDASTGSYQLGYKAEIDGEFAIDLEEASIKVTGELGRLIATKIEGDIFVRKSDLGIERITTYLSGVLRVKVLEQHIVPFSLPAIMAPARITLSLDTDNPIVPINFPLSIGKTWHFQPMNISLDGKIRSVWLNQIKLIDNIAGLFGIELIPPELAKFLPVIDIGGFLNDFSSGNEFEIPDDFTQYVIFNVSKEEDITVEAGTYHAYNITLPEGLGCLYYAPEVGNIIKISFRPDESVIPYFPYLSMELIETNYD